MKPPQKSPCGSCPYRCDAPSGLWHEDEYKKLPEYDRETAAQPLGVFGCHQQDGHLCAGWVATHDMQENLAIRVAIGMGHIDLNDAKEIITYETSTPLFGSGQEAADHGMREYDNPDERVTKVQQKLIKTAGVQYPERNQEGQHGNH